MLQYRFKLRFLFDFVILVSCNCTRELFEIFLKFVLVPKLKPGQILILDNASIRKSGNINEIVSKAGCKLIYLLMYSLDLNSIENC